MNTITWGFVTINPILAIIQKNIHTLLFVFIICITMGCFNQCKSKQESNQDETLYRKSPQTLQHQVDTSNHPVFPETLPKLSDLAPAWTKTLIYINPTNYATLQIPAGQRQFDVMAEWLAPYGLDWTKDIQHIWCFSSHLFPMHQVTRDFILYIEGEFSNTRTRFIEAMKEPSESDSVSEWDPQDEILTMEINRLSPESVSMAFVHPKLIVIASSNRIKEGLQTLLSSLDAPLKQKNPIFWSMVTQVFKYNALRVVVDVRIPARGYFEKAQQISLPVLTEASDLDTSSSTEQTESYQKALEQKKTMELLGNIEYVAFGTNYEEVAHAGMHLLFSSPTSVREFKDQIHSLTRLDFIQQTQPLQLLLDSMTLDIDGHLLSLTSELTHETLHTFLFGTTE